LKLKDGKYVVDPQHPSGDDAPATLDHGRTGDLQETFTEEVPMRVASGLVGFTGGAAVNLAILINLDQNTPYSFQRALAKGVASGLTLFATKNQQDFVKQSGTVGAGLMGAGALLEFEPINKLVSQLLETVAGVGQGGPGRSIGESAINSVAGVAGINGFSSNSALVQRQADQIAGNQIAGNQAQPQF
jgi:hypothetical protein